MNITEFIAKWRKVDLKERSASQEHFLDLCRVVGHPTPAEADPTRYPAFDTVTCSWAGG